MNKPSYNNICLAGAILMTFAAFANAEVQLPTTIANNIVLQRDAQVNIWGKAAAEERVTVEFAGQKKETTADQFGRWSLRLDPMAASAEGRTLNVTGAENTLTVQPVYVGDVWLYLSQSFHLNAEQKLPMHSVPNTVISISAADLWEHNNHAQRPLMYPEGGKVYGWTTFREPGKYFRNDGYYLGLEATRSIHVPIGIMCLGASTLESMTPPEGFQACQQELGDLGREVSAWVPQTAAGKAAYLKSIDDIEAWVKKTRPVLERDDVTFRDIAQPPEVPGPPLIGRAPTTFYNSAIHRYTPATIRGIIIQPKTYNLSDPQYLAKAHALIKGLRIVFGNDDLPVCFVQMHSPGRYEDVKSDDPNAHVALRAAQNELAKMPNTTVVASYDLVKTGKSEPDAGLRAAQWVIAEVGGGKVKTGPVYKSHKADGGSLVVEFDNTGKGLMVGKYETGKPVSQVDAPLAGFEVCCKDGVWWPASGKIVGNTAVLESDEVLAPVGVRYAWTEDAKEANLHNKDGFPALPFQK